MALNNTITASAILNRVAAEVGLAPVEVPYGNQDPAFIQLQYLLDIAGEELAEAFPWELLVRSHSVTTVAGDTGDYDLPADFGYIINQTSWDKTNNVPMANLSAQDWTYLKGRNLASNTLYASFRISQGKYNIFPNPPPTGLELSFEYITNGWVEDNTTSPPTYKSEVTQGSDIPLFNKTLITRALKVKWLEAGGFDTTKAQADFNQIFAFLTGTDKGAPVLNAGRSGYGIPYLSSYNTPDTGFGL
tara:strand:- start:964 stop:1701 length:738 start_codon:yes stop_codon:yes gene_type:complete